MAKQQQQHAPKTSAKTTAKTNAMRALDARGIGYVTYRYAETLHSADAVAAALGVPAAEVFKTLVVLAPPERRLLVVAPGDRELDLRRLARAVGAKAAAMAPRREAERLTGLKVGGISPLALLDKRFEVYVDVTAEARESLCINGGQRGVNLRVKVVDLLAVTGAKVIAATAPGEG
ncbi:MAG: YbaK/EbsC family protein [Ktedonobacterales bacterium]